MESWSKCQFCGKHAMSQYKALGLLACSRSHLRFLLVALRSHIDTSLDELDRKEEKKWHEPE